MFINSLFNRPKITVIINFFNMQREAERTLHSLTPNYQLDVSVEDYEVVAIDNGSTEPLDATWVTNHGANFHYLFFETNSASPCQAINHAAKHSKTKFIMCCIDGARILSPGILKYTLKATKLYRHPFIYTLGMHIGSEPQNHLVEKGYGREAEDRLLETIDWYSDGYKLFDISSIALSSKYGFFSNLTESNCFSMKKSDFLDIGGFDEQFCSDGGGLVNLDFFNKANADTRLSPIMLIGEATFHQFHGGVATNVPLSMHPWNKMEAEYRKIRAKPFASIYRQPEYFGSCPDESKKLFRS